MSTKTISTLAVIFGVVAVCSLTILGTLGVQAIAHPKAAVVAPTTVATADLPPMPAPEPIQPVVEQKTIKVAYVDPVIEEPAPQVAEIISVKPHMVSVTVPSKQCEQVPHTYYVQSREAVPAAGAVIGGVAGGLAGSLVHGHGREVAIGAGAALGALTGKQVQDNQHQAVPVVRYVTECNTQYITKKQQKGYDVTYVYNGQKNKVIMEKPPVGNTIPLIGSTQNTVTL